LPKKHKAHIDYTLRRANSSLRKFYAAFNIYSSNNNPAFSVYEYTLQVHTEVCPLCLETYHRDADISKYNPLGNVKIAESKSLNIIQQQIDNHIMYVQGGSNMTGTDLCVNKPHCAAAVRP